MELIFAFSGGVLFGVILIYFYFQNRLNVARTTSTKLQTELESTQRFQQQRLDDLEKQSLQVKETFTSLAQDVLTKHLDHQIKALQNQNAHDLDKKKQNFDQTFEEIKTTLKFSAEKINLFEKERIDQYSKIEKQIQTLGQQEQKLLQQTEQLRTALTTSQSVRGRWGELVLRNILAQSDLVSGIDFDEQSVSINEQDGGMLKPDFVIHLPQSGQALIIDSKASIFESYLEGEKAETQEERNALHRSFATRLRERVKDLGSKEYQKHVTKSLPYVVLFVPSEAAIRAAFDVDSQLFQWACDRKVFITSPSTILPLILLIAQAKKQYQLSEQAADLGRAVEVLGNRLGTFVDRLGRMQGHLDGAVKSWNEAIDKSWYGNQGITKSLEKSRELGGQIPANLDVKVIESSPRPLQ